MHVDGKSALASVSKWPSRKVNYASTSNIREAMKFYNLGDKIFGEKSIMLLRQIFEKL